MDNNFNMMSPLEFDDEVDKALVPVGKMLETTSDDVKVVDKEAREIMEYRLANPNWQFQDSVEKTLFDSPVGSYASVAKERVRQRELERKAPKTGYPELDKMLVGFLPGHLYLFSGQTNVGKTALAVNFANRVTVSGHRVLYVALEPDVNVVEYFASVRTGKKFSELSKEEILEPNDSIRILTRSQVRTGADLTNAIENHSGQADLIIVDHLGYFISSLSDPMQEQSNVMRQLTVLAKKTGTAIMVITHLRKPSGTKKTSGSPSIHEISGPAIITYDATDILIMSRDLDPDDIHNAMYLDTGSLVVRKAKAGHPGVMPLKFFYEEAKIFGPSDLANQKADGDGLI